MTKRCPQAASCLGVCVSLDILQRSGCHYLAAVDPGARAEIDDVIGAPHRFFIVLDNHERVPFFAQRSERIEQAQIIAWMKPDGGLVEHVKNAAQIRAELRGQTDPLRFAAAQRLRGPPERKVAQADVFHEMQSLLNLGNQVRRDRLMRSAETKFVNQLRGFGCGQDL